MHPANTYTYTMQGRHWAERHQRSDRADGDARWDARAPPRRGERGRPGGRARPRGGPEDAAAAARPGQGDAGQRRRDEGRTAEDGRPAARGVDDYDDASSRASSSQDGREPDRMWTSPHDGVGRYYVQVPKHCLYMILLSITLPWIVVVIVALQACAERSFGTVSIRSRFAVKQKR